MKVRLAKTSGFCMGVRRAMELVLAEANKREGPIHTIGPLIHNKQVMELLESKDVHTVNDPDGLKDGTLVVRAHGIPPDQRKRLKTLGLKLIDATCPRVAKVQSIIRYHTHKGYTAVIVGDRDHAEVIGLMGYGNGRAIVVSREEEIKKIPETEKIILVAQTTQDEQRYKEMAEAMKERFPDVVVFDTICDATHNRQQEVKLLADHVDGLVVVGGYHSGNTQRLVQISEASGLPTFHVETEKELDREKLSGMEVVGVTAGASTPNWMIKNVIRELDAIQGRRETSLGQRFKRALKMMLLSNLGVAFAALALTHAATLLSGRRPDLAHPTLSFLYIYAMHILNRFLDKGASTYNDPDQAAFYGKHKGVLILTGVAAMIGALVISHVLGNGVFFAMAGLSLLGIIYSIPIVPASVRPLWRFSKIKDIPGSKTFAEAIAWGAVIALIPLLESVAMTWSAATICFLFVFTMVYVRSALFDIFQVQGDLIVGKETLPIVLGEKKTLLILKGMILVSGLIFLLTAMVGLVGPFSFVLLLCYISLTLSLYTYEKRWLYPGPRLEALVEANFYLAGILALVWQIGS